MITAVNHVRDLVYTLKNIVGSDIFSAQFIKIITHYKKIGYNINILKPTANWSSYIFTLVQKVKHRVYKIHVF